MSAGTRRTVNVYIQVVQLVVLEYDCSYSMLCVCINYTTRGTKGYGDCTQYANKYRKKTFTCDKHKMDSENCRLTPTV